MELDEDQRHASEVRYWVHKIREQPPGKRKAYWEKWRAAVEKATFSLRAWNRPRKKPDGTKAKNRKKRPKKLSVTVSVGLADSSGKDVGPEDVLKKADKALYRAKGDGRNRVAK